MISPWVNTEHQPYQILFCFSRKIILRQEFRVSDYVSPPADLQTRTCSTKSERKQQNTTVLSVCWGWVWSQLWPDHHQQESSVLHRMSSDLIIMDIWSSHSLSLSLRLQIIKQYWHYLTTNYHPSTSPEHYQLLLLRVWKLARTWFCKAARREIKQRQLL